MKWEKYTIKTVDEAVDIISANLCDMGIEGIEIEDNLPLTDKETKGMFIDILPEVNKNDNTAYVSFYLEPSENNASILDKVRSELKDISNYINIGDGSIVSEETADKDWINNWKEFFKPFKVGDILIKPTWEDIITEENYKILIQIDPGTAFGTGSHETTKLCILQLDKYLKKGQKVLDIGTGSGILGITALKLGASYVFATDLDENVKFAVDDNLFNNSIKDDEFEFVCGDLIGDINIKNVAKINEYDIAVANILAPVIIMLQEHIHEFIKVGGLFITSGIINTKKEEVLEAFNKNEKLEIVEINYLGEWVNFTVKRIK